MHKGLNPAGAFNECDFYSSSRAPQFYSEVHSLHNRTCLAHLESGSFYQ